MSLQALFALVQRIPHSGQTIQMVGSGFVCADMFKGPMFRKTVSETPLHKKDFDEDCFRCQLDKAIEDIK
jgi:hypothetical protein